MEKTFSHSITAQEKKEVIEMVNMTMKGDVTTSMASLFQTLGKAVHENAVTKDDLWDIFVGTYHSDEEYNEMMENPDPIAALMGLFM